MKRLLFLFFIICCSCTTLETFTSLSESAETKSDYRFYDSSSKIRYQITNDDKRLTIRLNTVEKMTIMKILRAGFSFYFDVNGKKQTKVYFQYPLAHNGQLSVAPDIQEQPKGQRPEMDLKSMLVKVSKMGVFVSGNNSEQISVLSQDAEIRVSIDVLNNSEITYELSIPFSKISTNGIASLANLSVGVVSGKLEMNKMGKGRAADKEGEDGPAGMSGSGRPGGGMTGGGRHPGGMQGGDQSESRDMSAMMNPIEFWFKIDLMKKSGNL